MSEQTQHQHLYNTRRWKNLRRHQRKIEPLCRFCKQRGINTPGEHVDHIIPHNGDVNLFFLGELQTLCADCHNRIKRMAELHGFRPDVGLDGWPVDPNHPANRTRPSLTLVKGNHDG
jgi:5-methylcytosine-specific restriction enzyme A